VFIDGFVAGMYKGDCENHLDGLVATVIPNAPSIDTKLLID